MHTFSCLSLLLHFRIKNSTLRVSALSRPCGREFVENSTHQCVFSPLNRNFQGHRTQYSCKKSLDFSESDYFDYLDHIIVHIVDLCRYTSGPRILAESAYQICYRIFSGEARLACICHYAIACALVRLTSKIAPLNFNEFH